MPSANVAIIGGGVIGTAIARELSLQSHNVTLLESMPSLGLMTSTRNSGVLHGGVYYPAGSMKARFAIPGNALSQRFCREQGIPMKNCGKLITAMDDSETPQLEKLQQQGIANGVTGLEIIGPERIRSIEPNIKAVAALWVPGSCVVDAAELVKAYARVAASHGTTFVTNARVIALASSSDGVTLYIERGDRRRETLQANCVINAAGLYADQVAALMDHRQKYRIYPVRGEYARIYPSKAHLVNGLVYPLPRNDVLVRDATSRRVHLTRTISGDLLIGPTARYIDSKDDYDNNRIPVEEFYDGITHLLKGIELNDLELAHSGIRPQLLSPKGEGITDYIIERSETDPRLINLIGMETPGLTAAPAIAEYIASLVSETLS